MAINRFTIFNSIRAKLIALFLVSVFVTIAIVVGFNESVRRFAIASANSSLQIKAEQVAAEIDDFNEQNLRTITIGSSLPTLLEFMEANPGQQADLDTRGAVRAMMNTLQIYPYDEFNVSSVALLNLEGINLIDTAPSFEGTDESDRDYFTRPLISGNAFVSTVYFEPDRSGAYFYYSIPIRGLSVPKPIRGVLRIQISVSVLQNLILNSVGQNDAHLVLVDENMIRLLDNQNQSYNFRSIVDYSPTDIQVLQETMQIPRISPSRLIVPLPHIVPLFDDLDETQVATNSLHEDEAVHQRIALVPLESQPWVLLYGRHTDEFFAPVNRQTQGILALSIILTIGALAIAVWFAQSLSKPIRTLTEIAQVATKGDLDVHADIRSKDEVGTLAQAFNKMINELKHNKATLEERVAARTRELSEANIQLKKEIDERQRLEKTNIELALESERTRILANFIQNVSHEFKTPLSIINVQSHLLERTMGDAVARRVAEIVTQSKSIESLVNEMVMMARLDSDDYDFITERIYFDEFVQSVCVSEERAFKVKNIELETWLAAPDVYIQNNSQMLFTAIKYIMDNAARFTPEDGHVRVETMNNTDTVVLSITDTGIGIPEEDLDRVFERFYRVDQARTTRGFGLGLPIAKRIIERFEGTIHLTSKLDVGTTVKLSFPIAEGN